MEEKRDKVIIEGVLQAVAEAGVESLKIYFRQIQSPSYTAIFEDCPGENAIILRFVKKEAEGG